MRSIDSLGPQTSRSAVGSSGGKSALILRRNQVFADNLSSVLRGLPKKVLGVAAASALNRAIELTVHDSSRAAANWNLKIGAGALPTADSMESWDPQRYKTPPIGDRGDSGRNKAAVLAYKAAFYGYAQDASGLQIPTPEGKLSKLLRIGQSGGAPAVHIYNPIYSPRWGPYVTNAFKSKAAEGSAWGETVVAFDKLNTYLPKLIREELQAIRWHHAYKEV